MREQFASRLGEVLDFHNFVLKHYFNAATVDFTETLDRSLELAETIAPLTADVTRILQELTEAGQSVLFEGAQGAMLDIDHGTYPFVTSSNTVAASASTGTGIGPRSIDYVLGIVKAYTTRVGAGPFPTELFDDQGERMAKVGAEFGATTGRPRRVGWFDAVALKRSIVNNSVAGLCVTKLDVLDGMETIRICTGYRIGEATIDTPPVAVDRYADIEPVYEDMPGWKESTVGITDYDALPENARRYLARIEAIVGTSIDIISTGADREHTIVLRHPFD
jgi:adenylosuccinate synthase